MYGKVDDYMDEVGNIDGWIRGWIDRGQTYGWMTGTLKR